jgi:hypothetical protein
MASRADEHRRLARECLTLADTGVAAKTRASLIEPALREAFQISTCSYRARRVLLWLREVCPNLIFRLSYFRTGIRFAL